MKIRVANRYGLILALLCALFAIRIAGQLLQYLTPQEFLPAFDAFQGSDLGYGSLLIYQVIILSVMVIATAKVCLAKMHPNATLGGWLFALGGIYLAGSLGRIVIGLASADAHPWFHAWIPAFFHIVLASFLITLGRFHQTQVK